MPSATPQLLDDSPQGKISELAQSADDTVSEGRRVNRRIRNNHRRKRQPSLVLDTEDWLDACQPLIGAFLRVRFYPWIKKHTPASRAVFSGDLVRALDARWHTNCRRQPYMR